MIDTMVRKLMEVASHNYTKERMERDIRAVLLAGKEEQLKEVKMQEFPCSNSECPYNPINEDEKTAYMTEKEKRIYAHGKAYKTPKELKIGGYQTLSLRIEEMQKKINFLEADRGHRLKELERRVQQLTAEMVRLENKSPVVGVDETKVFTPESVMIKGGKSSQSNNKCNGCQSHIPCEQCDVNGINVDMADKIIANHLFNGKPSPAVDDVQIRIQNAYDEGVRDGRRLSRHDGFVPKDTVTINRKVAEKWLVHCRDFKHQSFHADLKNELRRALGREEK